ncbi:MurR/RpiR family transcriptional regulator [Tetragenococcus halophilus]|nr:MurR/RpiR family transcriptional regulator [Tetragenococcus koreensis]MDN6749017.1 MurR/RpiR family transcriptional regulator [Staphylococcus equorum]MDN6839835.1 MurR/RpiR family transcriptional regulator [Tetragenococcus halophilus]
MDLIKYFPKANQELTYAESLIFNYLEQNLPTIGSLTISKIAEENNVSTTTVVRLCKKLKIDSFSKLKFVLEDIYNQRITGNNNSYAEIERNFTQTVKNNAMPVIEKISLLLKNRTQIYIFAIGLTKACGDYFETALQQLGLNCSLISDQQVIWNFERPTYSNSLAIFLSNSGESEELISLLKRINKNSELTTLSVVNSPNSQLENLADFSLNGYVTPISINKSDFSPHFSLILLIDLLIQNYIKIDNAL